MKNYLLLFCVFSNFSLIITDCPFDWFSYESSCYKSFPAASYRVAMDKCFRLLVKQQYMKRAYLANLESQTEMDFVMYIMFYSKIKEIYIGANNIIKRTNFLSWERLGATSEVDKHFLCPDIFVESSSFYCGYLRNNLIKKNQTINNGNNGNNENDNTDYDYYDELINAAYWINSPDFCITTSDCFMNLPYLCEVNCTNQESKCSRWTQEYNTINAKNNQQPSKKFSFVPRENSRKVTKTSTTSTTTTSTTTTSTTTTSTTTTSTTTTSTTTTSTTTTSTTTTSTTTTSSTSSTSTTTTSSTTTTTTSTTSTLTSTTSTIFSTTTSTTSTTTTTIYNHCLGKTDNCQNNSTCLFNEFNDDKYTCNCIIGYEGKYCQRDERPCQPHKNKCKNNATCNQFYNTKYYNCTCASGFEGYHCEINIDDCIEGICQNGGQCEDLINDYKCNCLSFFRGQHCEIKNEELVLKENVSRSFSVLAIIFIVLTLGFFVALDTLRFVFRIEPEGLLQQRQLIRKKRLMKKIIEDMKSKQKRKRYRKYIINNYRRKDPFIRKLEKTFHISYDLDLKFIDDDNFYDLSRKSSKPNSDV